MDTIDMYSSIARGLGGSWQQDNKTSLQRQWQHNLSLGFTFDNALESKRTHLNLPC
jgi:hypothetical protein